MVSSSRRGGVIRVAWPGPGATLLRTQRPAHIPEARALLLAAEATAIEMNLPSELAALRSWFRRVGLRT